MHKVMIGNAYELQQGRTIRAHSNLNVLQTPLIDILRLVAQALAGPGLSGKSQEDRDRLLHTTSAEQSALQKLLANWRSVIESKTAGPGPLFVD